MVFTMGKMNTTLEPKRGLKDSLYEYYVIGDTIIEGHFFKEDALEKAIEYFQGEADKHIFSKSKIISDSRLLELVIEKKKVL